MKVDACIKKVMEARSGVSSKTGSTWMSQEFVIEFFEDENQRFADSMVVTLLGEDRIKTADLHEGDNVTVYIGHQTREYQGRYFNEIKAYNIIKAGAAPAPTNEQEDDKPF